MLAPADVLNAKCEFVNKVLAYLEKRKYVVDVCACTLYPYYARYAKVSILEDDCLTYDDICEITSNTDYTHEATTCDSGVACADQVDITLSKANFECNAIAETITTSCNCKYPTIVLQNNSEEVVGYIKVKTTFSGTCASPAQSSSVQVDGGCNSTDGCTSASNSYYSFGFNSDSTSIVTADSYITQLRVYRTDSFGVILDKLDLNLNPSTSPYLADDPVNCPGCTAIVPSELEFGDPNFESAFATLMDNVSLAVWGAPGLHRIYAWWNGTHYRIRCKAIHNPTGTHLIGINRNDANLIVVTPSGNYTQGINAFGDFDAPPHYPPIQFYKVLDEVDAPANYACANITSTIGDQVTYPRYNNLLSNFNKIVLQTGVGMSGYPIEVTDGSSESCESVILSAIYDTDEEVDFVEWLDPSNNQISTATLASATENGTHTFKVHLENGCVVSETIAVTEF